MNPRTMPLVRVLLRVPGGGEYERVWTMDDPPPGPEVMNELVSHVTNPRKSWSHPQDPITHTGDIKPDHEDAVWELLGGDTGGGEA